jgi:hypothetical protein
MEPVKYFVPGVRREGVGVLPQFRWPIPRRVAERYVEAYSRPGDIVLVPYCQGSDVVRAILESGRRALALHFDPLLVLIVQANLKPLPNRELQAALALLGDSPKQGVPLRDFLLGHYATSCPACLRPAVAGYYVWDREQEAPVARHVSCAACDWDGRAALEDEDRQLLAAIPRQGMHYHFVLDRVAPSALGNAFRARAEQLLRLYSARSLYALAELTLKIERHFQDPQQRVLKALLLDCLFYCSSLMPLPGSLAKRRGLARPGRYVERNVWLEFEEAAARYQSRTPQPALGLVDSLETFLASDPPPLGFVGPGLVRDLPRQIPARSLRLVLASPPPLDSSVWSLSYLWSAWLLGPEASAPLRPLLRHRTPDPAWYARVMAGSLRHLGGLLQEGGRLVLILSDQRTAVVEALLLAAGGAGLGVASFVQRGSDYRLELTPAVQLPLVPDPSGLLRPLAPVPADAGHDGDPDSAAQVALEAAVQEATVEAASEAIQARGEPVAWRTLHVAIQHHLARLGLLAQALKVGGAEVSPVELVGSQIRLALAREDFVRMPGPDDGEVLWWLAKPAGTAPALCDRVEAAASQVLQTALALSEAEFDAAVLERFPGILTPEPGLVQTCLRAYGREASPDFWQLREEDLPQARQAERGAMVEHLRVLGKRLGFRSSAWEPFDLAWSKAGQVQAAFVVRWQALLGEVLPLSRNVPGVQPYLVIPGGRSALVSYKLAHNPVWAEEVDRSGWRFIKYRHLRQLRIQPEVDEFALAAIIGLDPIVEQETAQLSLF